MLGTQQLPAIVCQGYVVEQALAGDRQCLTREFVNVV